MLNVKVYTEVKNRKTEVDGMFIKVYLSRLFSHYIKLKHPPLENKMFLVTHLRAML